MSLSFYSDSSCVINRQVDAPNDDNPTSNPINDFELGKCADWIKTNNFQKVCLQFPDSLLPHSINIALALEKHLGYKVYILGDSSYASCCTDEITAAHISADVIIHFGHTCLSPVIRLPVYYVLPRYSLNIGLFVEKLSSFCGSSPKKILLLYDVGYYHLLGSLQESIQSHPILSSVIISNLSISSSCHLPGDYSGPNVENSVQKLGRTYPDPGSSYEIVYISGEDLSNLEAFAVSNPSIPVHKYTEKEGFTLVNVNTLIRKKLYLIEKIKDASTIGILIATLGVKDYLSAIDRVKQLCKQARKKSYIISVGKPNVAKLANLPEVELFVMVSCPETRLANAKEFMQPVVSVMDIELALNKNRTWEGKTTMDFRDLLDGGIDYQPIATSDTTNTDEDDADVSLITNKVRSSQIVDSIESNDSQAVALKQNMTCVVSEKLTLSNRSWQGLQQNLGLTPVVPVEEGRLGTPASGYTSSKSQVKS